MLVRVLIFLLLPLALLSACEPALPAGPRIDLVGSTRFLAGNRLLTVPGDTVTTKLYASTDESAPLQRVRILVEFAPRKNPLKYDSLTSRNIVYRNYPKDSIPLVYLDTLLAAGSNSFVFQNTFSTRTTSGTEKWTFEGTDTDNRTSRTSINLALHNIDSALVYHRYTIRLQTPRDFDNRPYLALLSGLTFPRYSARMSQDVQKLIDLIYLPSLNNGVVLASPSDKRIVLKWPVGTRRATRLRAPNPALDLNDFNSADTPAELASIFDTGTPYPDTLRTPLLVKGQFTAFRTTDNKSGVLYVQDFVLTPVPSVILQVHIQK